MALWRTDRDHESEIATQSTEAPKPVPAAVSPLPHPVSNLRGTPSRRDAAQTQAPSKSQHTVIASDLTIVGNLISKGEVFIEGEIQGDVQCDKAIFGEGARLTGTVIANEVVVNGTISGAVRGNKVLLNASSRVEGDIHHQSLAIEQGAFFEGKSRRTANPTEIVASDVGGRISS